jgi:large subunit ribosomal protein L15
MPFVRRLPKCGFSNPFRIEYTVVNLQVLASIETVDPITPQALIQAGVVKRKNRPVKILGMGDLNKPIVIQAHKFSKSAVQKIESVGGRAEVIGGV